jgi:hypothetical protein
MTATTPTDRRALLARTIAAHRSRDDGATFRGTDGQRRGRVVYSDRVLELTLPGAEGGPEPLASGTDPGAALDAVLAAFPVFKRKQPETRKAPDGTVYVSALADAKHCADFVETVLREVYALDEGYELRTVPAAGTDGDRAGENQDEG